MGEHISLEEFEEYFWNYIPRNLISDTDIQNNKDWADGLVHDTWRLYQYSGVDKAVLLKNVENMLFSYKRHNPILS